MVADSSARGLLEAMSGKKEEIEIERHSFGGLILYEVTSYEIEQLERETLTIAEDLTFATIGLTVGISFLTTLLTVDNLSIKTFTLFVILCVVGFAAAFYCGIRWFSGRRSFKRVIVRIRTRVGPLGQEGKEIGAGPADGVPQTSTGEGTK